MNARIQCNANIKQYYRNSTEWRSSRIQWINNKSDGEIECCCKKNISAFVLSILPACALAAPLKFYRLNDSFDVSEL